MIVTDLSQPLLVISGLSATEVNDRHNYEENQHKDSQRARLANLQPLESYFVCLHRQDHRSVERTTLGSEVYQVEIVEVEQGENEQYHNKNIS